MNQASPHAIDTVFAQANPRETEVLILQVLEPAYAHGHALAYAPEVLQIMEEERENGKNLLARASVRERIQVKACQDISCFFLP
jgi:hypothetical protein